MDTNQRVRAVAAAVTGARHVRSARNGQDAAAAWTGERRVTSSDRELCAIDERRRRAAAVSDPGTTLEAPMPDDSGRRERLGAIVVCDGCGSGLGSELGARLGAQLVIAALSSRLAAGGCVTDPKLWASVRADVCGSLGRLVAAMPGDREQIIHDYFLFTIVAAAVAGDDVGVWAIGDGTYAIIGTGILAAPPRVLGPFAGNQPPYLAYDLLDAASPAHLETARTPAGTVLVATDGVADVGLETFTGDAWIARYLRHPDALRRQLAVLARSTEHIEWAERRTIRTPAALQDDGALAILRWATEEPS